MSKWTDKFYFFLIDINKRLWYYGDNSKIYSGISDIFVKNDGWDLTFVKNDILDVVCGFEFTII